MTHSPLDKALWRIPWVSGEQKFVAARIGEREVDLLGANAEFRGSFARERGRALAVDPIKPYARLA